MMLSEAARISLASPWRIATPAPSRWPSCLSSPARGGRARSRRSRGHHLAQGSSSAPTSATTTSSRTTRRSRRTGKSSTRNPTACRSSTSASRKRAGRSGWRSSPRPRISGKLDRYKEISQRLAHAEGLTDDQARALAAGRQGGRLDRRRPARERGARLAAADRDGLPAREPQRRRDDAHPARRHHPAGQLQSRRRGAHRQLVHARSRSDASAR